MLNLQDFQIIRQLKLVMSEEDTAKWEGMKSTLSKWPSMSLDEEGTFKYVLIEAAAFMEVQQL